MRMFITLFVFLCLAAPAHAVESRSLPLSAASGYAAGPVTPRVGAPSVSAPVVGAPAAPLPPSLPALTPSGGVNLDEAWIRGGGARLYWNTLVIPRQIRMGGARFVDPATVPELFPSDEKKAVRPVRRSSRSRVVAPAATQKSAQSTPPAGAASTALKPPAAAAAAKQPDAGRGKATPDKVPVPADALAQQPAPYGGAAPAAAASVPLPEMPSLPAAPKAPTAPR